jgi:hypothetical protein
VLASYAWPRPGWAHVVTILHPSSRFDVLRPNRSTIRQAGSRPPQTKESDPWENGRVLGDRGSDTLRPAELEVRHATGDVPPGG